VIVLMNLIKSSQLFASSTPICIQFENQIFANKSANDLPLTMTITDVFGRSILAANKATNARIIASHAQNMNKKAGPNGQFVVANDDANVFYYNFGKEIRNLKLSKGSHGLYALDIAIDDDNLSQTLSANCLVKVTTNIEKIVFGIQYAKKSDFGYNKVSYPDTFVDAIYDVSPSQKVKFEIEVKAKHKASQIVVDIVSNANGESVAQIVPKTRQDKYGLTIDVNKASFAALAEGQYSVNLIIGDALFGQTVVWQHIVTLNCFEEEDEAEIDYEPVNDEVPKWAAQAPIAHTFGSTEKQSNIVFSLVFCIVTAMPLLLFVYFVFGASETRLAFEGDVGFSSCLFVVALGGIVFILFLYWWQWNIFEAAGWLSIACVPAFFFGYNVLRQHLLTRIGKAKTN